MIRATDKMIARRADTRARADFATWTMMAKLNGLSSLSAEAQDFLEKYKAFLKEMPETEAANATITLIVKSYYAEMGGVGSPPALSPVLPPVVPAGQPEAQEAAASGNVTAFRRPRPQPPKAKSAGPAAKPRLPVALIFAALVVVYVGIRYYLG